MRGAVLRELREERGLKAAFVASRAGYKQPHYSKIEDKESISVEELERIAPAIGVRPGDLLDNSCGEIRPLLPLVEELKKFEPRVHEHVRQMLASAALIGSASDPGHAKDKQVVEYNSGSNRTADEPHIVAGLGGAVSGSGATDARDGATTVTRHRAPRTKRENR